MRDFKDRIETVLNDLKETLIKKNAGYGDAAARAPILCPEIAPETALYIRLSDKIARLKELLSTPSDCAARLDTIKDLAGYAILLLAADNNAATGKE